MLNTKSKITGAITAAAMMLSFAGAFPAQTARADEVTESAEEAVANMNVGWNLGNTLDSYGTWIDGDSPEDFETAWNNPVTTEAMIDSVADSGFNTIRIPVTWAQHIDDNGNVDEAWMARVKEVVDYAYDRGMYVILNTHHDGGEGGGDKVSWLRADSSVYEQTKDKFAALWTNIANEFKDYGQRLIFEGYNELIDSSNTWNAPSTGQGAYDAVNGYAQTFVDSVRATGGNNATRNLIVQTYVGSWDNAVLNAFVVPTDSAEGHLICEVHVYSPWGFTGTTQSVNWTTVHNDFNDSDKSEIDGMISSLVSFRDRIGIPVIIGECGAESKGNDDQIAIYAGYLASKAEAAGIVIMYWDNGDYNSGSGEGGYAIFDRSSLTWKTDIVNAMMDVVGEGSFGDSDSEEAGETEETAASEETSEESTDDSEASAADETEASEESAEPSESSESESEASEQTDASEQSGEEDGGGALSGIPVVPLIIVDVILVAGAGVLVAVYRKKKQS